jgi:hypothetical protein
MEDLQQVVEGTIKLENTKSKDLNLTHLILSGQAEELFPEMIKRMSLNYELNLIQDKNELEKLREAQLTEIFMQAEEHEKGKGICPVQKEQKPDNGLEGEITEIDEGISNTNTEEFKKTVKELIDNNGLNREQAKMLAYLQHTPIKETRECIYFV